MKQFLRAVDPDLALNKTPVLHSQGHLKGTETDPRSSFSPDASKRQRGPWSSESMPVLCRQTNRRDKSRACQSSSEEFANCIVGNGSRRATSIGPRCLCRGSNAFSNHRRRCDLWAVKRAAVDQAFAGLSDVDKLYLNIKRRRQVPGRIESVDQSSIQRQLNRQFDGNMLNCVRFYHRRR